MKEKTRKRTYFRPSTVAQRRRLFEVWEETKKVKKACEAVRLSRGTFYYWKPRFEKEGYKGLEETQSHAPNNPKRTEEKIVEQVIEMKKLHPNWGYQRIADELMKANKWIPVVSAMTVARILRAKGLACSNKPSKRLKKN